MGGLTRLSQFWPRMKCESQRIAENCSSKLHGYSPSAADSFSSNISATPPISSSLARNSSTFIPEAPGSTSPKAPASRSSMKIESRRSSACLSLKNRNRGDHDRLDPSSSHRRRHVDRAGAGASAVWHPLRLDKRRGQAFAAESADFPCAYFFHLPGSG